jgi:hypothetical protein
MLLIGLPEAYAASAAQEQRCSGVSVFQTAKKIFHKNPTNHAEAAIIAGSTEKGREYSEKLFDECVSKGK